MRGSYNLTGAGLRNAQQHGVTAAEIWQVVRSPRHLSCRLGADRAVIYGATRHQRQLIMLLRADAHEDDVWDVVSARERGRR
jgi:uncharacterized DUF497 family protein